MLLVSYNLAIFLLLPLTTFDQNVDHYCHFRVEQHSQGDGEGGGVYKKQYLLQAWHPEMKVLRYGAEATQGASLFQTLMVQGKKVFDLQSSVFVRLAVCFLSLMTDCQAGNCSLCVRILLFRTDFTHWMISVQWCLILLVHTVQYTIVYIQARYQNNCFLVSLKVCWT